MVNVALILCSCSEEELRSIFMRYGMVQSAIVNREKRHAFVKMCNRNDAVRAKLAMEDPTDLVLADKVRKVGSDAFVVWITQC